MSLKEDGKGSATLLAVNEMMLEKVAHKHKAFERRLAQQHEAFNNNLDFEEQMKYGGAMQKAALGGGSRAADLL